MVNHGKDVKIFACNSNHQLAEKIAANLGMKLGDSNVGMFSDGEIAININEMVRGSDVFVIQSTSNPVNNNLMELLIMIDALKRASASRITAVMPYFGYARQDRKSKARDPISAKLVADLLTTAGADRVLTMDLHAAQIQGFFNIPVDHLKGGRLLSEYYMEKFPVRDDVVVVSPDLGSVTRARDFAAKLDVPIAIIDKRRPKPNVSEVMNIIGDIKDKTCILLDDMIDTAGTIVNGAHALAERGAKEVYACCTHGVLSGPAMERIDKSPIKELLTLDTIVIPDERKIPKIKTISVATLFAEAIRRIYNDTSLSELF
ncbi:MAG: ribose-phosphate diphosphokinase [Clostridia bacterium]|nr:ribose-phosphate diphosphokinase [Clostridia bacterium]